jgi:hypothetical protein
LILVLVPMMAVLYWLRWRLKKDRSEEELVEDIQDLRRWLVVAFVVTAAAGFTLYLTDDRKGEARMKYIPPYEQDGVIVPGHFVPMDEKDKDKDKEKEGEERSPSNNGDNSDP